MQGNIATTDFTGLRIDGHFRVEQVISRASRPASATFVLVIIVIGQIIGTDALTTSINNCVRRIILNQIVVALAVRDTINSRVVAGLVHTDTTLVNVLTLSSWSIDAAYTTRIDQVER